MGIAKQYQYLYRSCLQGYRLHYTEYQISYQRQVKVIAMSNNCLQLIFITLLGDKNI